MKVNEVFNGFVVANKGKEHVRVIARLAIWELDRRAISGGSRRKICISLGERSDADDAFVGSGHDLLHCSSLTCPLWVKSGHGQCTRRCPLYPRKRTCRLAR